MVNNSTDFFTLEVLNPCVVRHSQKAMASRRISSTRLHGPVCRPKWLCHGRSRLRRKSSRAGLGRARTGYLRASTVRRLSDALARSRWESMPPTPRCSRPSTAGTGSATRAGPGSPAPSGRSGHSLRLWGRRLHGGHGLPRARRAASMIVSVLRWGFPVPGAHSLPHDIRRRVRLPDPFPAGGEFEN